MDKTLLKEKVNHILTLEPHFSHRFKIDFFNKGKNEIEFHDQSVRNFNLSSVKFDNNKRGFKDKKFLNLKIDLMNIVGNLITPEQIFDIKQVKINFLDPIGTTIDYYLMDIELDNFELKGDYGNDELSTYKLSFFVSCLKTIKDETIKNN